MDHYVIRIDSCYPEHAAQQRGFILAVSVAVAINIAGGVRLVASDSDFNRDVANLGLQEGSQSPNLRIEVGFAGDQSLDLFSDLGRGVSPPRGQSRIPMTNGGP